MNLVKLKEVVGNKKQANGNIQKKPKYTYIFGKGQLAKKDLHKLYYYILLFHKNILKLCFLENYFWNVVLMFYFWNLKSIQP